jgi:hypothetical protein
MKFAKPKKNFQILIFIGIFLLSLIPRIWGISQVPTGISNDELDYVINAKTFWLTRAGLTGNNTPLRITNAFPNAELVSILLSPILGPLPFSFAAARIPVAILGAATVLLLYLITKILIGEGPAIFVALVAILNPWNIFFSRIAYDAPFMLFFLLLGFYMLLMKQKWNFIWAVFIFILAFHTYMGMMIVFPFFVLSVFYFSYLYHNKKYLSKYLIGGLILTFFMIRYLVLLPSVPGGTRTNQIMKLSDPQIIQSTDTIRRLSVINPFTKLYANKLVLYLRIFTEKYFTAFSPDFLFLKGDTTNIFSLHSHGQFYPIDAFFIILGIVWIYGKNRRLFLLLFSWALIAPLPSAVGTGAYFASRSYLLQPVFIILTGCGIYAIIYFIRQITSTSKDQIHGQIWPRTCIFLILGSIYLLSFANFLSVYFYQNPIANSESYNFSSRLLARLAKSEIAKGQSVLVISPDPKTAFKQYLFYTNNFSEINAKSIIQKYQTGDYSIGLFNSIKDPNTKIPFLTSTTIFISNDSKYRYINPEIDHLTIPILADAGNVYSVYHVKTCNGYELPRFPHDIFYENLNIQDLTDKQFCSTFIIRL